MSKLGMFAQSWVLLYAFIINFFYNYFCRLHNFIYFLLLKFFSSEVLF